MAGDMGASVGAHPRAEALVVEQAGQLGLHGPDFAGRDEGAGLAGHDQLGEGADGGGDDWDAGRHGLQGRDAEAFPTLGCDEDVEGGIPVGRLGRGHLGREEDALGESGLPHALAEGGEEGPVTSDGPAHDDGADVGPVARDLDHGVHEDIGALLVPDAAEATDPAEGRQPEAGEEGGLAGGGLELGGVDAMADDDGGAFEVGGGLAGGGDDGVHAPDEEPAPCGVAALGCGGEDELEGGAEDEPEEDSTEHFDVPAGVPDAPWAALRRGAEGREIAEPNAGDGLGESGR